MAASGAVLSPRADAPASGPAYGRQSSLREQEDDSVAMFQRSWQTYQKLLAADYLEHTLLYAALREQLLALFNGDAGKSGGGIAMLDLGCGDAQQIARTLQACGSPAGSLPLASYTGVDVSAPALALAGSNLAFLQPACTVHLVEQDMVEFVEACQGGYDLVFASFAMHHLTTLQAKAEFLAQVARCLKPGGACVLVDVFLREGECRAPYMARYQAHMDSAVAAGIIQPAEAATVMAHVTGFDYPERPSELAAAAVEAGFRGGASVEATDSQEFGRLMVLRK